MEMDETEGLRKEMTERERLEERHGRVWDTQELSRDFEVLGFYTMAPYVIVRKKKNGVKGTLIFQHAPRFYFSFVRD